MWQKRGLKQTWRGILGIRNIYSQHKLKESPVHEVQFPTPNGYIAGKWWGSRTEKPIIALHGYQDNAGTFDTLAPLLECRSLLALDFPGHGLSTHVPPGRTIHYIDFLVSLRRLTYDLGWNKITFLAHSFGSVLSYYYGGLYPKEVERIVSIDCARGPVTVDSDSALLYYDIDTLNQWIRLNGKLAKGASKPVYSREKMIEMINHGSLESISPEGSEVMMIRGAERLPDGYAYTRDLRLKGFFLNRPLKSTLKAAMVRLDCHVLSIHATDSYFIDKGENEFTDMTFEKLIKPNSNKIIRKINVPGTHHSHLNNPEFIAPHINEFFRDTSN